MLSAAAFSGIISFENFNFFFILGSKFFSFFITVKGLLSDDILQDWPLSALKIRFLLLDILLLQVYQSQLLK